MIDFTKKEKKLFKAMARVICMFTNLQTISKIPFRKRFFIQMLVQICRKFDHRKIS